MTKTKLDKAVFKGKMGDPMSNSDKRELAGFDDAWSLVSQFHRRFGLPIADSAREMPIHRARVRASWMAEELEEFLSTSDLVNQTDAMIDLIYLAIGTLVEIGVPPSTIFSIVHESNLAKVWPDGSVHLDPNGKVIKPKTWHSPNTEIRKYLETLLTSQPADDR